MDRTALDNLLKEVASGKTPVVDAARILQRVPMEDIGFAHIDHHRSLRKGFPEVIFGEGKTDRQIIGILEKMALQESTVLVTRVDPGKADQVCAAVEGALYHKDARMIVYGDAEPEVTGRGTILILSAGTSDIPVAREAFLTARAMGNRVNAVFDVGVAGIHRLLSHRDEMAEATVLVVAAGMEGALPSVVAGMVNRPVIAIPTSIGYGVSLGGMTALFAMLNSCSSNVAVVNIDNGFGAGYMASMINR